VPWNVVIPMEERDLTLADKLALELDAVLGFLVTGYQDWRAAASTTRPFMAATEAYRAESDALRRFIDQRCLTGPAFRVRSSELFAAWQKWCAGEGKDPGTADNNAATGQTRRVAATLNAKARPSLASRACDTATVTYQESFWIAARR